MTTPILSAAEPVTTIVRWWIKPESEPEFKQWQAGIAAAAAAWPGFGGLNVIRHRGPDADEYVTIFRFATYAQLRAWEDSPERRDWLDRVAPLTRRDPTLQQVSGLEYWFTLDDDVRAAPPRWKMLALTSLALYPLANMLGYAWAPIFAGVSPWIATLVTLPVSMALMTYVVMPRVTRMCARWLYPQERKH